MAKEGIDYFSLDVGFLRDKKIKLIKGEFGAKGIVILLQILSSIYEEGYFRSWDDDDCYLVADAAGCGITPELTTQVVLGCVRRSIFDERLFNKFGILTSHGIQWRYIRAAYKRDIEMFEEYLLLDMTNKNDVPASSLNKITLKSLSSRNLDKNSRIIDVNSRILKQSKVKKSKVNINNKKDISSINHSSYFPENEKLNKAFLDFIEMRKSIKAAMTERAITLMIKKIIKLNDPDTAIAMLEQSIINGWKDIYELKQSNKDSKKVVSSNKFNQFPQRPYTKEEYNDMESRLLQK